MRLFVGIGIPPECRRAVAAALGALRGAGNAVSWVAEPNLHITLKFLGETPPARAGDIGASLEAAAAGIPPFDLYLEGGGAFPESGPPRVLWAGIREPLELVGTLHQNIENALSSAGVPREGRRFHPHITVGRVRGRLPPGFGERFGAAVAGKTFGVAPVSSFQLYESRLFRTGAVYGVVRGFPLAGRDDG